MEARGAGGARVRHVQSIVVLPFLDLSDASSQEQLG